MSQYNGRCCFCCRWAEFAKLNDDFWLEEMIRSSVHTFGEEPGDAQCRAWISCRKELKKALKQLPKAYGDVFLVFEYVLPRHKPGTKKHQAEKGIRPDVLLVGRDFVTVLEFKQRKTDPGGEVFQGYIAQAGKYTTRLNRYHKASREMFVAPVVVLTLEKQLLEDWDEVVICSGDQLAAAVLTLEGDSPSSRSDHEMLQWLESDFAADDPQSMRYSFP